MSWEVGIFLTLLLDKRMVLLAFNIWLKISADLTLCNKSEIKRLIGRNEITQTADNLIDDGIVC